MPWHTYQSPLGPLTLTSGARGLQSVHFPGRSPRLDERDHDPAALADVAAQLEEYFTGTREVFDLELDLTGSPFRQRVWAALREIPYAATTSYGQLAQELGVRDAAGAPAAQKVGWAIGATPTPILVPCHRVLAADGSLTGYLGGLHRKRALLDLEGRGRAGTAGWEQRQLALL